jgi:hypothetical protein
MLESAKAAAPTAEAAPAPAADASPDALSAGLGGAKAEQQVAPPAAEDVANKATTETAPVELPGGEADAEQPAQEQEIDPLDQVPENASGYTLTVPDDMDFGGMKVALNPEAEQFAALRDFAHAKNLTQRDVDGLVRLYLQDTASSMENLKANAAAQRDAEIAKIGKERIVSAEKWLSGAIGKEANKLFPLLKTAAGYEAIEALERAMNKGTAARPAPASTPDPTKGLRGEQLLDHQFNLTKGKR